MVSPAQYWNHLECRWETCSTGVDATIIPSQAEPVDAGTPVGAVVSEAIAVDVIAADATA